MSGILSRITGLDELRRELKERTDQLLRASVEWKQATNDLTHAIREHQKTVKKLIEVLQKL